MWNDVAAEGPHFLAVGDPGGIRRSLADGGSQSIGGAGCSGLTAISVNPGDQAVSLANTNGELLRFSGGTCSVVNGLTPGLGTAVLAVDGALFYGSFNAAASAPGPVTLTRLEADGGAPLPRNVGTGQVWQLSGTPPDSVFAAGWEHMIQRRATVWRWDPQTQDWATSYGTNAGQTPLFAIDFASPTVGFAGGERFLQWNGTSWSVLPAPDFTILGLRVFGPTEVYAVGSRLGTAVFAQWDGTTWRSLFTGTPPSGALVRVAGNDRCHLFGVGAGGLAVTTAP